MWSVYSMFEICSTAIWLMRRSSFFPMFIILFFWCDLRIPCVKIVALLCGECAHRRFFVCLLFCFLVWSVYYMFEFWCIATWRMRRLTFFSMCFILFFCVMCVFHVQNWMRCCVRFFNSEYADHMAALLQRTKRNSFFAARRRESQSQPRKNDARGCCCNRNDEGSHARGCVTALQIIWA